MNDLIKFNILLSGNNIGVNCEKHIIKVILGNPPFSEKWIPFKDERFNMLAPKSKADFAFIQHMIYQLDDKGTMVVVLPHGVLFRGAAEGVIRKYLIEERNLLDAVIGLPANIFYGTSIPTVILVFKKCREHNENILFIDASNEFDKGKKSKLINRGTCEQNCSNVSKS